MVQANTPSGRRKDSLWGNGYFPEGNRRISQGGKKLPRGKNLKERTLVSISYNYLLSYIKMAITYRIFKFIINLQGEITHIHKKQIINKKTKK